MKHAMPPSDEINFKDIFKIIHNRKKSIGITVVLCAAIAYIAVGALFPESRRTNLVIETAFHGIQQKEYPDGTPFIPWDFVDASDMKAALLSQISPPSVDPNIPLEAQITEIGHPSENTALPPTPFARRYEIFITTPTKHISNTTINASFNHLIDQFRDRLQRHYQNAGLTPIHFPEAFLSRYDYAFAHDILEQKTQAFKRNLSELISTHQSAFPRDILEAFKQIHQDLLFLESFKINSLGAMITEKGITRSPEMLLMKYQHKISELKRDYDKYYAQFQAALQLMETLNQAHVLQSDTYSNFQDDIMLSTLELTPSSRGLAPNAIKNTFSPSLKGTSLPAASPNFMGKGPNPLATLKDKAEQNFLLKQILHANYAAENTRLEIEHYTRKANQIMQRPEKRQAQEQREVELRLKTIQEHLLDMEKTGQALYGKYVKVRLKDDIEIIRAPRSAIVNSPRPIAVSILTAVAVFIGMCFLMLFIEDLRDEEKNKATHSDPS